MAISAEESVFRIQPDLRELEITRDHDTVVQFEVSSRAPVRGEAHIVPISAAGRNVQAARDELRGWLSIVGPRELDFDGEGGGFQRYGVHIVVPDDAEPGEYVFRLKVTDIAQPDEEVGESGDVRFHVVGPQPGPGLFILAAVIAFLLLAGLAAGLVVYVQNETTLQVVVSGPESVNVGDPVSYEIAVTNRRSRTVTGVQLEYALPEGVSGGYASVDGAILRHCDERERLVESQVEMLILCDLGTLPSGTTKTVRMTAFLDPNGRIDRTDVAATITPTPTPTVGATATIFASPTPSPTPPPTVTALPEITLRTWEIESTFVVSSNEVKRNGIRKSHTTAVARCLFRSDAETPDCRELYATIDPSTGIAPLGEPVAYTVRLWNNNQFAEAAGVVFTYTLPAGMRYELDAIGQPVLPPDCETIETFVTVQCTLPQPLPRAVGRIEPTEVQLNLIPTGVGEIRHEIAVTSPFYPPTKALARTTNVNTALRFDGIDDWVELGYRGLPDNFTVEMWVHPFTTDNGQSFIGAHTQEGKNMFLLGYWQEKDGLEDGLLVNVMGSERVVTSTTRTDRYHLAVTVAKDDDEEDRFNITTYINGNAVQIDDGTTLQLTRTLTTTAPVPRNWVLGQDWDPDSPEPSRTDFFKGTMSEVRLWNVVRNQEQIRSTMARRPLGTETGLAGYWRLEPAATENDFLADRVLQPLPGALEVAFRGARRLGATWGGIDPRYGTALSFDGVDDALAPIVLEANSGATGEIRALLGQPDAELSVAAWVYAPSVATERQWIVGQLGSSNARQAIDVVNSANQQLSALNAAEAAERLRLEENIARVRTELDAVREQERQAEERLAIAQLDQAAAQQEVNRQVDQLNTSLGNISGNLSSLIGTYASESNNRFNGYTGLWQTAENLATTAFFQPQFYLGPLVQHRNAYAQFINVNNEIIAVARIYPSGESQSPGQFAPQLRSLAAQANGITGDQSNLRNIKDQVYAPNWFLQNEANRMPTFLNDLVFRFDNHRAVMLGNSQSWANTLELAQSLIDERDALLAGTGNRLSVEEAQAALDAIRTEVATAQDQLNVALAAQPADRSVERAALQQQRSEALTTLAADPGQLWAGGLVIDEDGHVTMTAIRIRQRAGVTSTLDLEMTAFVRRDEKSVPSDRWVHYAGTLALDGGDVDVRLFRNGKEQTGDPVVRSVLVPTTCTDNIYIGGLPADECGPALGLFFRGRLDEVRIFDHALERAEVLRWRDRADEFAPDNVAYWPFDDGPSSSTSILCDSRLSCDRTATSREDPRGFHIDVSGPAWIDANHPLADGLGQ